MVWRCRVRCSRDISAVAAHRVYWSRFRNLSGHHYDCGTRIYLGGASSTEDSDLGRRCLDKPPRSPRGNRRCSVEGSADEVLRTHALVWVRCRGPLDWASVCGRCATRPRAVGDRNGLRRHARRSNIVQSATTGGKFLSDRGCLCCLQVTQVHARLNIASSQTVPRMPSQRRLRRNP